MSNHHILKIHPKPLADLLSGAKTCEVRFNDRGFEVGDTVALQEINPQTEELIGDPGYVRVITHIQQGYGLPEHLCVLSYAQPAAGEPVEVIATLGVHDYFPNSGVSRPDLDFTWVISPQRQRELVKTIKEPIKLVALAAPPAAAHGDEAVRKDADRYQALRNTPEIFIGVAEGDDMVFLKSPDQLDQLADNAAAMRAQGDGEAK